MQRSTPTSVKKLQSFVGGTGYWRYYTENYSDIITSLTALMTKFQKCFWGNLHEHALEEIKEEVCSNVVLKHFDVLLPIKLH